MLEVICAIVAIYLVIGFFVLIFNCIENGESISEGVTSGLFWGFWLARNVIREFVRRLKQE